MPSAARATCGWIPRWWTRTSACSARPALRAGSRQPLSCGGGPFLHGFSLPGVPEFERWAEQERAALTHDYAEVLETLAARGH